MKVMLSSAFFPSPFEEAKVLVVDGVGEWDTTTVWSGNKKNLVKVSSIEFSLWITLLSVYALLWF